MVKVNYTEKEKSIINKAWFTLVRITESTDDSCERCLSLAIDYECGQRSSVENARLLILRGVYEHNKIAKHEIFRWSRGIRNCIVMANYIFHNNHSSQIQEFKKLAQLAIKAHNNYMERLYAAASL